MRLEMHLSSGAKIEVTTDNVKATLREYKLKGFNIIGYRVHNDTYRI